VPELPEVEVTRRAVEPHLVGRRIAAVTTTGPSYFFLTPPARLKRELPGRRVLSLERHGKYLVAHLDDGKRLLLHLGMTGQLFASGSKSVRLLSAKHRRALGSDEQPAFRPDSHTHLQLRFEGGGTELYFRDMRKFGKVALLEPGVDDARLDKLGVDALKAKGAHLHDAAQKRRTPIKSLLLDQAVIAGIGNIYADESLFLAGILPTRDANRVSRKECDALVEAARRVLRQSIRAGGSSIDDFVRPDGSDGGYQHARRVYAREGEPCQRCNGTIVRIVIGQRSSHYCNRCQH
jgi:formamidopyrimidine-DNA glycosylase